MDHDFASREAVERAVVEARETGQTTGQTLLEGGVVTPDQLARAVAERYGIEHVDLNDYPVDKGATALVDPAVLRKHRTVPIAFLDEKVLLVATADPANVLAIDDLSMMTGYDIRRAVATEEDVDALLGRLGRLDAAVEEIEEEEDEAPVIELRESAEDAPVVKLVRSIVADAVERGASDIHFDPDDKTMRVRFRVDGVVSDTTTVPRGMVAGLVSRVKIMADLDIAEKRLPQDGRVGLNVDGRHVDIRVATLPTVRGESVVMRVLDKGSMSFDLDHLGMAELDVARLRQAITQTHGSLLATGPTGSGKTTTLYAALTELNTPEKTLLTIEDPVEYELEGVKQVQVNNKSGLTFATGLRSMMRADPDVMMVGEIRDRETAQIAIESALTGHYVLSTLHTNDAPMSVARLIEMGIEPFLVASGIYCVVAQRLARHAVRLQGGDRDRRRGAQAQRLHRRDQADQGLRARGLRALRAQRLPRPDRPLRGDGGHRRDARADRGEALGRRDRRGGGGPGHAPAARRRAGQGPRGRDLHGRRPAGPGRLRLDPPARARPRAPMRAPRPPSCRPAGPARFQRHLDQPVRQPDVLRQQGAVQVGADHVAAPDALEAVVAVVAVAGQHPAQGLGAVARGGCARRGSRSPRSPAGRRPGRPRSRSCRSAAGRPRARCAGPRGRCPGSSLSPIS